MTTNAPFPIHPEYTAIAIAYRNATLIADRVLPRFLVGTQEFKYMTYDQADSLTIPNTYVGRKSEPNTVEFGSSEQTAQTDDYGLQDLVPQRDIDNAPDGHDPRANAIEGIMDLVLLDREKRCSDTVFAAGTYPSGNKATLSGTTQWSHASSTPIPAIMDALDAMPMRPNVGVFSRETWNKLRQHADIVSAVLANSGTKGLASLQAVADLFELDEILIGGAWYNSAGPTATGTLTRARVWGKHAAFLLRDESALSRKGITFGGTAQFGARVAASEFVPRAGLKGSHAVWTGESVNEVIMASDTGYLFTDAVA